MNIKEGPIMYYIMIDRNIEGNIKAQQNRYYEKNKDRIRKKRRQQVICECGAKLMKGSLTDHKKTKKHNTLIF